MEKAIKRAIEGGYRTNPDMGADFVEISDRGIDSYVTMGTSRIHCTGTPARHLLLDPLFWQALGKAEGWNENWYFGWFVKREHGGAWEWREKNDENVFWGGMPNEMPNIVLIKDSWDYQMHCFIDHLIEGKDIDSYFNNLLK